MDIVFTGIVIKGHQRGRTIGFPTANIIITNTSELSGVFVCEVWFGNRLKRFPAMCNIGGSKTLGLESKSRLEVHIFDFDEDLYGKSLSVKFLQKIRENMKFESVEELKEQLEKDKATAL
jgi:riboflavin kinase/FMN adenylyltransferase